MKMTRLCQRKSQVSCCTTEVAVTIDCGLARSSHFERTVGYQCIHSVASACLSIIDTTTSMPAGTVLAWPCPRARAEPSVELELACGCFKVHHEQIMEQEASAMLAVQFGASSCGPS